jgi:hypothetical protein
MPAAMVAAVTAARPARDAVISFWVLVCIGVLF